MDILQGTLIGKTALLMHNPAGMRQGGQETVGRKVIPTPEEEAEASTYRLPNKDLCVPAVAVRNSILGGCTGLRIGKRAASPIIAGALLPSDLMFPLVNPDGEPFVEYVIDTQRAVVVRQGIMRSRARIDAPWIVAYTFNLNTLGATADAIIATVRAALATSGPSIGILDYRPQKKGWYGTYEAGEMRVISG